MDKKIELKKVSKYYSNGDTATTGIIGVDLTLSLGEIVAITGESGSGKSTLLNVISGVDSFEEGSLLFFGEDTSLMTEADNEKIRKEYIANVFQDFNLIDHYTVYENIELVFLVAGRHRGDCKEKITELLRQVGIEDLSNEKASKLSGGQKQCVAIARALASEAPIIVADEPTGNLDAASARTVIEILCKNAKSKLVVIVTHNYELLEPYVTRKIVLRDGYIVEDSKTKRTTYPLEETKDRNTQTISYSTSCARNISGVLAKRNVIGLPHKFFLCFLVYCTVFISIIGLFAAIQRYSVQNEYINQNYFLLDNNPARIIISKKDRNAFTPSDITLVENIDGIEKITEYDITLDTAVYLNSTSVDIVGPVRNCSELSAEDITQGNMPKKEYEAVLCVNRNSSAYNTICDFGDYLIGEEFEIYDAASDCLLMPTKIKIVGMVVDNNSTVTDDLGYTTIYVNSETQRIISLYEIASKSNTTIKIGSMKIEYDSRTIYTSPAISEGKACIPEELLYYFPEESKNDRFLVEVRNSYFENSIVLDVEHVVSNNNCESLIGINSDEYDYYDNCIFVSLEDFNKLFDKGEYQISAYSKDVNNLNNLESKLIDYGFIPFIISNSFADASKGYDYIIKLIAITSLLVEYVVLFAVAYGVISLIMKSRGKYFAILRIIGTKRTTINNIVFKELFLVFNVSFLTFVLVLASIKLGALPFFSIEEYLSCVNTSLYVCVYIAVATMTMLISHRYVKNIFSQSAMKICQLNNQ